jgi:DNA repair exonuclease SbcCD ATPase subunit
MSLLAVTMYEFRQFLQLLMWVALPLVLVATVITIAVHYWRKKRNREAGPDLLPESDNAVMPQMAEPPVEGQQGYKGVLWLRNKYEQDIEQAAQKHGQLKEQYHQLEKRHQELLDRTSKISETMENNTEVEAKEKIAEYEETIRLMNSAAEEKTRQLENLQNDVKKLRESEETFRQLNNATPEKDLQLENLQNEIRELRETGEKFRQINSVSQEKDFQLENLQNEIRELRETNASLKNNREGAPELNGILPELSVMQQELLMAQQEKASLKAKLIEQESLQDLLQEKTTQIHFLENQLEQRIKSFHEVEFQGREDADRARDFGDRLAIIGREKQEQSENIQAQFERILQLENELQIFNTEHVNMQNELNEKIHFQAREIKEMGDRLEFNNRLLRKLQREINTSLEYQFVQNTDGIKPAPDQSKPKISAWIESPSEEEFEHII